MDGWVRIPLEIVRAGLHWSFRISRQMLPDGGCMSMNSRRARIRTVCIDVWMVDSGAKVDLWRLEGVISGKVYGEEVDAARVGRLAWPHYRCLALGRNPQI